MTPKELTPNMLSAVMAAVIDYFLLYLEQETEGLGRSIRIRENRVSKCN